MSSTVHRSNMRSVSSAGPLTLAQNQNRNYLWVTFTAGTGTIAIGGGAAIPFTAGDVFEPHVVPTSEVVITKAGGGTIGLIEG
jgi:hypothetical protein